MGQKGTSRAGTHDQVSGTTVTPSGSLPPPRFPPALSSSSLCFCLCLSVSGWIDRKKHTRMSISIDMCTYVYDTQ